MFERPRVRRKLQKAYDCDTYEEAKENTHSNHLNPN